MNVKAVLLVGLLMVFGFGAYVLSDTSKNTSTANISVIGNNTNVSNEQAGPEIAPEVPTRSFSVEEVAAHATADDCWTIIGNNVYDITPYVPRHPGGRDILLACGTDGSSLFNQRLDESGNKVGSGSPHSSNAASQLEKLIIGSLAQ